MIRSELWQVGYYLLIDECDVLPGHGMVTLSLTLNGSAWINSIITHLFCDFNHDL